MAGYDQSPDYSGSRGFWRWIAAGLAFTLAVVALALWTGARADDEPRTSFTPDEVRFTDGDTFWLADEKIRFYGLDTPEPTRFGNGECIAEEMLGDLASLYVEKRVNETEEITIARRGTDRHGRTLADVYLDGDDLIQEIIAMGYGEPYVNRTTDWCAPRGSE